MNKKIRLAFLYAWQPLTLGLVALIGVSFLLWFQLGSLLPGLSSQEATLQSQIANNEISLKGIYENPFFLPYSLATWTMQKLGFDGTVALRSLSALIGIAGVVAFYWILKYWHTTRMAILGTLLFATSSWFLHTARYATPHIMYLSILVLIAAALWLQKSSFRRTYIGMLTLLCVVLLYIPGMIWLLAGCAYWQLARVSKEIKKVQPVYYGLLILLMATLLIPLLNVLAKNPLAATKQLLGLPETLPTFNQLGSNLSQFFSSIFVNGPGESAIWLTGTPILNLFMLFMFVIGSLCLARTWKLERSKAQIVAILLGSILIIIGGVPLIFILPFIYLVVTGGISYMLNEWFGVFPRNVIARTAGASLLTVAVLVTSFYDISRYFIAWPNTPATRNEFSNQTATSDTIDR